MSDGKKKFNIDPKKVSFENSKVINNFEIK